MFHDLVFGNGTDVVSWTPEPTRRGTFSILTTCISTILLCVWKAVHLNVPEYSDRHRFWFARKQFWRKIKWLLLALVAPELVAHTAWHQRRDATMLMHEVCRLTGQEAPLPWYRRLLRQLRNEHPRQEDQWTLTHAFYAVMGGFALDSSCHPRPFIPPPPSARSPRGWFGGWSRNAKPLKRLTLTPFGLKQMILLRPELFPNITEAQIKDKSKADFTTNAIVCAQAMWFCFECVSRIWLGLPISLLELNTFVHSICTLCICVLWWHKPLDIEEPTIIQGDQAANFMAYAYMTTVGVHHSVNRNFHQEVLARHLLTRVQPYQVPESHYLSPHCKPEFRPIPNDYAASEISDAPSSSTQSSPLSPSSTLLGPSVSSSGQRLEVGETHDSGIRYEGLSSKTAHPERERAIDLQDHDTERWRLATQLFREAGNPPTDTEGNCPQLVLNLWEGHPTGCIRSENWPTALSGFFQRPDFESLPKSLSDAAWQTWVVLSIAGFFYGGFHVCAWNAHFPTDTQRYLWRCSAVIIMSYGVMLAGAVVGVAAMIYFLVHFVGCLWVLVTALFVSRKTMAARYEAIADSFGTCYIIAVILGMVAYAVSRVYLIGESFLSLPQSPAGVYEVPQWSVYFPHIS